MSESSDHRPVPVPDPAQAPAPAADPSWSAYGDTILVFPDASPPIAVDLRRPIESPLAERVVAHVTSKRFGVVTPENPAGQSLDAARNAARLADFAAALARDGRHAVRADGRGGASDHVEHGFAIVAEQEAIRTLAAAQGQTAFYWFDGTRMWLCPTRPDATAHALPVAAAVLAVDAGQVDAARLDAGAPPAD